MTLEPFHDYVRDVVRSLSCVLDVNDVLMTELTCSAGFALEEVQNVGIAYREVRKENLERNSPVDVQVVGAIDRTHSPNANERLDPIFAEQSLPDEMERVLKGEEGSIAGAIEL
jgi:hypothetical protein